MQSELANNWLPITLAVMVLAVFLAAMWVMFVSGQIDDAVIESAMLGNGAAPDTAEMEVADTVVFNSKGIGP